jgi:hypothetical protein
MVISGMISMEEASAIRKKVVDNRHTIQRAFSDIHLKSNTELLSELRLFMHKPTEYAIITSASSSIAYSPSCNQCFSRTTQPAYIGTI